jgi:hypothetical protein
MEESRARAALSAGKLPGSRNDESGGIGLKRSPPPPGSASAAAEAAVEQLRGKKLKFKMGETLFRSHKL